MHLLPTSSKEEHLYLVAHDTILAFIYVVVESRFDMFEFCDNVSRMWVRSLIVVKFPQSNSLDVMDKGTVSELKTPQSIF